ncbi:alpha/beta fold hydrolase [Nocardia jejuensis]|uniref:alpha/beta fold hydrolase n=1 Tax=Nocardia jejuensis TaxID=328049 RepID=UPI000830DB0B|nr:alpha/beta fold hydrolase [Nocardia jejuensis]
MKSAMTAARVLALALVLASCSHSSTQDSGDRLRHFYDQQLSFGDCDGYATTDGDQQAIGSSPDFRCARLEVPLDYGDPGGRTASIAVLKAPARGERIGSLLLNPGGPGGPGMAMAAVGAKTWAQSPITERFDLIGFDPRGVGASTPAIECFSDAETDAGTAAFPMASSIGRWTAEDTRALVDRCAERSGGREVLAHVGTRDAVRDMDILRAALGEDKLSYLGQSYGTRMGPVYAETFPKNVRAMVLDSAIDPHAGTTERRITQFEGFQRAFEKMAADCTTRPDCPLGADPAQTTTAFQQLARPLTDHPIRVGDRSVGFADVWGSVTAGLYDSAAWPVIIKGLTEIREGRGDTIVKLSDAFGGRGADGRWPNFAEAAYAINCLDEERHTPEQETDLRRRLYEVAPYMDPGQGYEGARDGCESWPAPPTLGYPYAVGIQGLPHTLTIGITGDPATPYPGSRSLAAALGGALLTVEGEQHTIALSGTSPCVNDIVADYLVTLKTPPAEARCTL